VHVGAHASGPAGDLSGQGFDIPGKPPARLPSRSPGTAALSGELSGDTVTLEGAVDFSSDPSLEGIPAAIIANTSTGAITFVFDGSVLEGSGSVLVAHS